MPRVARSDDEGNMTDTGVRWSALVRVSLVVWLLVGRWLRLPCLRQNSQSVGGSYSTAQHSTAQHSTRPCLSFGPFLSSPTLAGPGDVHPPRGAHGPLRRRGHRRLAHRQQPGVAPPPGGWVGEWVGGWVGRDLCIYKIPPNRNTITHDTTSHTTTHAHTREQSIEKEYGTKEGEVLIHPVPKDSIAEVEKVVRRHRSRHTRVVGMDVPARAWCTLPTKTIDNIIYTNRPRACPIR